MKKLLTLVLVLSMAALANATVTMSISGDTSIAQSATKSYTVSYSGDGILSFDMDCVSTDSGQGTLSNFTIVAAYRDTAIDYIGDPLGAGQGAEVSATNDLTTDPLGAVLFTFDLTAVASSGSVVLQLTDNATFDTGWNQVFPTMNGLTVNIPEPITLALLGLGGLFIRRKK